MEETFLYYSTPIVVLFILLEMGLSAWHKTHHYYLKDTVMNLVCTGLNMLIDLALRGLTFGFLTVLFQYSFFQWEKNIWYWLSMFLCLDFCYYLLHCADHYCRLFWAVHVTHHNSEKFNLTVGFRSSVFQPIYRVFFYIPLPLLGFEPLDIMLMHAICQTWGIFVHTEHVGKLGFLEHILVTPSHHRVHHACNIEYLDKNMGMVLIIWDKLFGTFQKELPHVKPTYGITHRINHYQITDVLFCEWKNLWKDLRATSSWRVKLNYLLRAPGWSPDGRHFTAKSLQKKLKETA